MKKFLLVILVTLMSFVLIGCHKEEPKLSYQSLKELEAETNIAIDLSYNPLSYLKRGDLIPITYDEELQIEYDEKTRLTTIYFKDSDSEIGVILSVSKNDELIISKQDMAYSTEIIEDKTMEYFMIQDDDKILYCGLQIDDSYYLFSIYSYVQYIELNDLYSQFVEFVRLNYSTK